MAKATCLQVLNKVQENLGEAQTAVGSITALSGLSLLIFNTMNEVLLEISMGYQYQFNETDITLTMTNVSTYSATGINIFDKDSFRYDNVRPVPYQTPQKFDRERSKQNETGVPQVITFWKGFFRPYPQPQSSEYGKVIQGRGWNLPTAYTTATASGTSVIPEGFDLTLLANWVTFKVLAYKQNPEAVVYKMKVFGDGQDIEGQVDVLKRIWGSPQILDGQIMVEPMESSGNQNGFVQAPITG